MDRYIGTKIVLAEPMSKATAVFMDLVRDASVTVEADGTSAPGYKVVYEDGYTSWAPKATFERAYRRITNAELVMVTSGDSRPVV